MRRNGATIGVVLVNWNGGEFTIPCIDSLVSGTVVPDRIVVVDNASEDGSGDAISVRFPNVHLLRNATNRGFAAANNQGIAHLIGHDTDYIWLLNNDTVVAPDCCEQLLTAALCNPFAVGISAKIYFEHPPTRVWYAGGFRHRWHLGIKHVLDASLDQYAVNAVVRTEFISGCCMFVSRAMWIRYGGLRERYIAYSEDNDWCWRVTENGGSLYYAPLATLWHKVSASVRKNTQGDCVSVVAPLAQYLMCRNHVWTIRHHSGGAEFAVAVCVNVAIVARNAMLWVLKGDRQSARAALRGLCDGYLQANEEQVPRLGGTARCVGG